MSNCRTSRCAGQDGVDRRLVGREGVISERIRTGRENIRCPMKFSAPDVSQDDPLSSLSTRPASGSRSSLRRLKRAEILDQVRELSDGDGASEITHR
jgi:hypothetical protein